MNKEMTTEEKVFFVVALKEKIRQAKAEGAKTHFFTDPDGIERVYLYKCGDKWLEEATLDDILRVSPR